MNLQELRAAPVTYGLIGLFIAVYVAQFLVQLSTAGLSWRIESAVLYQLGANFSPAFAAGEYWRILTSCFLHLDPLHLGMNSMALSYFGPILERSFGGKKLLLGFVLTGMVGSLLTSLMHLQEPYLSAGASGGLYGLFGILFVTGKRYRAALPPGFQVWLNQSLGLLIVFSFAPFIDMWGHFGGLLMGLALAWLYKPLPLSPAEQQAAAQLLAEEEAAVEAASGSAAAAPESPDEDTPRSQPPQV